MTPQLKALALAVSAAALLSACGGPAQSPETETQDTETAAGADQAGPAIPQAVADARACSEAAADLTAAFSPPTGVGGTEPEVNATVSDAFVAFASAQPCVFALDSGLRIRVDNPSAEGALSPVSGEMVRVHYEGKLPNGEVFDSSYDRGQPAEFPSDRLIRGWVEALPMMRVGETWTLVIPPELGYGPRGTPGGPIGPNEALVFKVELLGLPGREDEGANGE